jgi:tetratricopeptide (TPR) repeat protein
VLSAAAVIGRNFDARVLEAITAADVVDALDEASAAGLVRDSGRLASFQFAHALVRDTLLAELSSLRRARLHEQVATALDALPHDQDRLAEIAMHAIAAGPVIEPDRMATWTDAAANHLFAKGAYDDALGLWRSAVAVLDDAGFEQTAPIARLLSNFAGALWWNGERDVASGVARRGVAVAQAADDDEAFVQAVAALGRTVSFGLDPELIVDLVPEALTRARPDTAAYAQLRGMQILAGYFSSMGEDLVQAGRELIEMAARVGDDSDAASARFIAAFGAAAGVDVEYARRLAERSIEDRVGGSSTFPPTIYVPAAWAALRAGDLAQAEVDVATMAAEGPTPMLVGCGHQIRSLVAAARLDLDRAFAETQRVREMLADDMMFFAGCELQDTWTTYLRSGAAAALERGQATLDLLPYPRFIAGLTGFFSARAGELDGLSATFARAFGDGVDDLGRDWAYAGTLHLLAELAADLGRASEARVLDEALEPYGDQLVLAMCTHVPASVPFARGRLAIVMGERERGIALFGRALAIEERAGATALARRTRAELEALDARG